MKQQDIKFNIARRLGIGQLNEMQLVMLDDNAPLTMLIAPTGTGKTLAFAVAVLHQIGHPSGKLQAVVIAPSRELVLQIYEVMRPIAPGYKTVAMYGGHSMQDETNSLIMMPDIIVATPGRLVDHIKRGNLKPGVHLSTMVLDEYDKSLELGFSDEMKRLMRFFVSPAHVILTSATVMDELPDYLPRIKPNILDYSSTAVGNPRSNINIARVGSPARDKLDTLLALLLTIGKEGRKIIVFLNHRESVERVYEALRRARIPAGIYHGGLDQVEREKAIELLDNGTTPVLVSTDLASRGLDIDDVDAVVHYHLPPTPQAWVHRNGRTARQGARGEAYVITTEGESIPDYVEWDRDFYPAVDARSSRYPRPQVATLYFAAGKKEKLSRGDIVGFLIKVAGLEAAQIGRISLKDHCALVGVPASAINDIITLVKGQKIKNQKVKITRLQ